MKILVIDRLTGKSAYITTDYKPVVGDNMPVMYMNQRVVVVSYFIGVLKAQLIEADMNTDFVVYTE